MAPPRPAQDPTDRHPHWLVRTVGRLLEFALFWPIYSFMALHLLLLLLTGRLIAHAKRPAGSRP